LIEDRELRPDCLYDPKEAVNRRRVKVFPCEYCHQKITDESKHKCYEIEAIVRKKAKREIKHEFKTENSRGTSGVNNHNLMGIAYEPTMSTVPKQKVPTLDSDGDPIIG
jgi:hypothetical protein